MTASASFPKPVTEPIPARIQMTDTGVIDPTKVVRFALQKAASIAGLMLATEAMITEKPRKKKKTENQLAMCFRN